MAQRQLGRTVLSSVARESQRLDNYPGAWGAWRPQETRRLASVTVNSEENVLLVSAVAKARWNFARRGGSAVLASRCSRVAARTAADMAWRENGGCALLLIKAR